MSEREFEHYLTLLGSMLRLRPEQRAEIAEELQQHLDERLQDLQAAGLSREDAIQQALAEFGDAAGLAAQFSSVSRRRYRRWMMRAATASVTSAFMVLVLFVSFWPTGGRIELALPTTAQDTNPPASESPVESSDPFTTEADLPTTKTKSTVTSREAKNADTRVQLETESAIELRNASLSDLSLMLAERLQHGCLLDYRRMEEEGVDRESGNLNWNLTNASLGTMLETLLDEVQLTYQIRDGILVITSQSAADDDLSLVIYDAEVLFSSAVVVVRNEANPVEEMLLQLVQQSSVGEKVDLDSLRASIDRLSEKFGSQQARMRFNQVADLIETQVDPNSWEVNGGVASISSVGNRLIVRQTERTHRKIRKLLDDLAATNGL
jgi:hypothetical protein